MPKLRPVKRGRSSQSVIRTLLNDMIEPLTASHRGGIVKLVGDSLRKTGLLTKPNKPA